MVRGRKKHLKGVKKESSSFPTVIKVENNAYSFGFKNESAGYQGVLLSYFLQLSTKERKIEEPFEIKNLFLQRQKKTSRGKMQKYKLSGNIFNNMKAGIQSNSWINLKP